MSKTILITGTSSGFGKLMAASLAKQGHQVIAALRGINDKNAAAAQDLAALPNVEVVELDVTSTESVNAAVASVLSKHKQIDVLVNNAGVAGFGLFEATSLDNMRHIFEVNLFGLVRTYQAVLPSMRANKSGLIINISSGLGLFSTPFLVPYNATKFAVEGLTEGLRDEIKPFGIETVTVLPGAFPTSVGEKAAAYSADRQDIIESYGPTAKASFEQFGGAMFGKMNEIKADPQEVADAVVNLVNMPVGTRPFQTVVNRVTDGIEQRYADSKLAIKADWVKQMGW